MKTFKLICPYCGKEAEYIDSKNYYSNGVSYGMIYICWPCDAFVGVHKGSNTPLGTMANKELREYRKKVHALIDPLWQSGKLHRAQVYNRLSRRLGVDYYHTGNTDIKTCQRIISFFTRKRKNWSEELVGKKTDGVRQIDTNNSI